jgi:hypothetical protein
MPRKKIYVLIELRVRLLRLGMFMLLLACLYGASGGSNGGSGGAPALPLLPPWIPWYYSKFPMKILRRKEKKEEGGRKKKRKESPLPFNPGFATVRSTL